MSYKIPKADPPVFTEDKSTYGKCRRIVDEIIEIAARKIEAAEPLDRLGMARTTRAQVGRCYFLRTPTRTFILIRQEIYDDTSIL